MKKKIISTVIAIATVMSMSANSTYADYDTSNVESSIIYGDSIYKISKTLETFMSKKLSNYIASTFVEFTHINTNTVPMFNSGDIEIEEVVQDNSVETIDYSNEYSIPDGTTDFYGYMDLYTITDTTSTQYSLIPNYWLDSQGLWRYGDDYVVAMGTYYTPQVGSRFSITTDDGNSYTVFVGEIKADCDTDATNKYVSVYDSVNNIEYKNVIEFVINTPSVDNNVLQSGTIGTYSNIGGNITSILKID